MKLELTAAAFWQILLTVKITTLLNVKFGNVRDRIIKDARSTLTHKPGRYEQGNMNGGNGFMGMIFMDKYILCSSNLFAAFGEGEMC